MMDVENAGGGGGGSNGKLVIKDRSEGTRKERWRQGRWLVIRKRVSGRIILYERCRIIRGGSC